jgi:hypothetical protein
VIKVVRRPAYPGEFNHELIWPLAFVGAVLFAAIWFQLGLKLPDCWFFHVTGYPCLGCGGTRCARQLTELHFHQAFLFHPGFTLLVAWGFLWSCYGIYFWFSGSSLRWRLVIDEAGETSLRWGFGFLLVIHWLWQCYYLRPLHA